MVSQPATEKGYQAFPELARHVTFVTGNRRQGVEVIPVELILVPFGIVVAALLVVGAVTGAAFKFVWIVLKVIFVVCFWWLLLLIGGVALLRSIVH
jgi:hypothetical protein